MSTEHAYSDAERRAVYRAIAERRDMRHFRNAPVDETTLTRLLAAAHQAPSVGLMQPWHFIRVTDAGLRERIHDLVDTERRRTAEALGELLGMPAGAKPIAVLCLGHVEAFYDRPMLEQENWTEARPLAEFVSEDG